MSLRCSSERKREVLDRCETFRRPLLARPSFAALKEERTKITLTQGALPSASTQTDTVASRIATFDVAPAQPVAVVATKRQALSELQDTALAAPRKIARCDVHVPGMHLFGDFGRQAPADRPSSHSTKSLEEQFRPTSLEQCVRLYRPHPSEHDGRACAAKRQRRGAAPPEADFLSRIERLKAFIRRQCRQTQASSLLRGAEPGRACLLLGPSGTGKRLCCHLLIEELGYRVLELGSDPSPATTAYDEYIRDFLKTTSSKGIRGLVRAADRPVCILLSDAAFLLEQGILDGVRCHCPVICLATQLPKRAFGAFHEVIHWTRATLQGLHAVFLNNHKKPALRKIAATLPPKLLGSESLIVTTKNDDIVINDNTKKWSLYLDEFDGDIRRFLITTAFYAGAEKPLQYALPNRCHFITVEMKMYLHLNLECSRRQALWTRIKQTYNPAGTASEDVTLTQASVVNPVPEAAMTELDTSEMDTTGVVWLCRLTIMEKLATAAELQKRQARLRDAVLRASELLGAEDAQCVAQTLRCTPLRPRDEEGSEDIYKRNLSPYARVRRLLTCDRHSAEATRLLEMACEPLEAQLISRNMLQFYELLHRQHFKAEQKRGSTTDESGQQREAQACCDVSLRDDETHELIVTVKTKTLDTPIAFILEGEGVRLRGGCDPQVILYKGRRVGTHETLGGLGMTKNEVHTLIVARGGQSCNMDCGGDEHLWPTQTMPTEREGPQSQEVSALNRASAFYSLYAELDQKYMISDVSAAASCLNNAVLLLRPHAPAREIDEQLDLQLETEYNGPDMTSMCLATLREILKRLLLAFAAELRTKLSVLLTDLRELWNQVLHQQKLEPEHWLGTLQLTWRVHGPSLDLLRYLDADLSLIVLAFPDAFRLYDMQGQQCSVTATLSSKRFWRGEQRQIPHRLVYHQDGSPSFASGILAHMSMHESSGPHAWVRHNLQELRLRKTGKTCMT